MRPDYYYWDPRVLELQAEIRKFNRAQRRIGVMLPTDKQYLATLKSELRGYRRGPNK